MKVVLATGLDPRLLLEAAAAPFLTPRPGTFEAPFPTPPCLLVLRQGGLRDDLLALAEERGIPGWFDPPICTFQELPQWFGAPDASGVKPLGDFEREALLGDVLRRVAGAVFGVHDRAAHFLRDVDRLFGQLVSEDISPDAFRTTLAAGAQRDEFEVARDKELSDAYALYLGELARLNRTDGRDEFLRCAGAIAADPAALGARLRGRREIRILGLADLRGGWRHVLRALDASPAIDRVEIFTAADLEIDPALVAERRRLGPDTPLPAPKAFELIPAADEDRELEAVGARVRALIDGGTAPHRIAVVARAARPLVDVAVRTLERFGVPAAARLRTRLAEVPAVRAVLALVGAAAEQWDLHSLRDIASQPYLQTGLDDGILQRVGTERRLRGLAAWEQAIATLLTDAQAEERKPEAERDWRRQFPPSDVVRRAAEGFGAFKAEAVDFEKRHILMGWLGLLLGFLERDPFALGARARRAPAGRLDVVRLDVAGLRELHRRLGEWRNALTIWNVASVQMDAAAFHAELTGVLRDDVSLWTSTPRGVQVLEALAGEYRAFDHVFLVGMGAGAFPQRLAPSPLYAAEDASRLAAAGAGVHTAASWREREATLFRVLVAGAARSVTLSYVALDRFGGEAIPSVFVEDLAAVAEQRSAPVELDASALPALPVADSQEAIEQARHTVAAEQGREVAVPGPFNGGVEDPALVAGLARRFHADYPWSPTSLEEYAVCPWAWFAKRVLRLDEMAEPEEGLDPRTRGTVLHDAFKRFYDAAVARVGGPVFLREADREWAEPLLRTSLLQAVAGAEGGSWLGHPALRHVMQAELERTALAFLNFEMALNEDTYSTRKHARFRLRTGVARTELPVETRLERGGETVRFKGIADRVEESVDDRVPGKRHFTVADYKSSIYSVPGGGDKGALNDRIALQLPLYGAALEAATRGSRLARLEYRPFATAGPALPLQLVKVKPKEGLLEEDAEAAAQYEAALDRVVEIVQAVRAGRFPAGPAPSAGCSDYCLGRDLCRIRERVEVE